MATRFTLRRWLPAAISGSGYPMLSRVASCQQHMLSACNSPVHLAAHFSPGQRLPPVVPRLPLVVPRLPTCGQFVDVFTLYLSVIFLDGTCRRCVAAARAVQYVKCCCPKLVAASCMCCLPVAVPCILLPGAILRSWLLASLLGGGCPLLSRVVVCQLHMLPAISTCCLPATVPCIWLPISVLGSGCPLWSCDFRLWSRGCPLSFKGTCRRCVAAARAVQYVKCCCPKLVPASCTWCLPAAHATCLLQSRASCCPVQS